MKNNKGYRPNVAAIVLSSDYPEKCEFLLFRRRGQKRSWQFPQGGIDEGETKIEALLRELDEEIGTNDVEILGEYPDWISYDFPPSSNEKRYPFRGQKQKYFLVRLKDNSKVDIDAFEEPEFDDYQCVTADVLFKKAAFLKRRAYKRVIDYFTKKGLL